MGQQSHEAIVKQRLGEEQREAKDMEEVESGTRPDIASYILREDSLELQFLYVSQILNNHLFQTDNKTKKTKMKKNPNHCILLLMTLWVDMTSTGCPKKWQKEEKNLSQIECCEAKFSHEHDLGALDPA